MKSTQEPLYLSVIIPSYNEKKNFSRGVLQPLIEYLKKQKYDWELIFSDDGSTDGTTDLLRNFVAFLPASIHSNIHILENDHAGKGPTVQAGMLAARGKWRLFTDFDQSTPLSEVEKLFAHIDKYPIVIGSREGKGAKRVKEPLHRHLMGRAFNLLVQLLAIPGIFDTQCGFKLFSAEATEKLFNNLFVYGKQHTLRDAFTGAFDVEALFLARKYGFAVKEVPIEWAHNETDRVSAVKDSVRMLRDIIRVRIADLQGRYKKA
jgi:dolichyl-phosphate beta-glucosyltransferase